MKVFLIAVISADGYIGPDNSHSSLEWNSGADKKHFRRLTKDAGVIVMGANTYRTINHPLPGRRNIVYSRKKIEQEGIETTQESPQDLVKRLEQEGHERLAVCGGQAIYDMFLHAGVVDELYLTIEPVIFGSGLPLTSARLNLELLQSENLNPNTMLLHYKVLKG
jgi:dihydrofolate reductase